MGKTSAIFSPQPVCLNTADHHRSAEIAALVVVGLALGVGLEVELELRV